MATYSDLGTVKAIPAHLSEARVKEIVRRQGLPALIENTITDEDELYAELEETRERGYSINDQETIPNILLGMANELELDMKCS